MSSHSAASLTAYDKRLYALHIHTAHMLDRITQHPASLMHAEQRCKRLRHHFFDSQYHEAIRTGGA